MGPHNIVFRKKFTSQNATRLSLMTLAFNVGTSVTQRDSSHWREAYFEFRDEIENCLLSVSCLETRTRFCPPNLEPRDKIENFVHRISGLETRSRILFPKSRNSRRDRDFSIILPKHISQKKKIFPINAQTLQCN